MAKGKKKAKISAEEIEADRIAAHQQEQSDSYDRRDVMNLNVVEQAEAAVNEALGSATPVSENLGEPEQFEPTEDGEQTEGDLASVDETEKPEPVSVVAPKYKDTYIANAKANGISGKAARRSNWDWLAQQLAKACLGEKESINMGKFIELLDLNGVDYSKWTNRNRGWEGRFRMTGRVVLQKVVADRGSLLLPDGASEIAPEEWRERFKTKKAAAKVATVKEEVVDGQF